MLVSFKRFVLRALEAPFVWAAAMTAAYYTVILQDSIGDNWLRRYTTEHAVEYFITGFFIWGLVEIAFRLSNYPREWRALDRIQLPSPTSLDRSEDAAAVMHYLEKLPPHVRTTRFAARLLNALRGIRATTTVPELRDHLSMLADQDDQAAHSNYALVRFIVWLAPVLGFLGTVIHFGTALSGLSPDTISDQLSHIVGEMGTAFNTTTTALAASTTMMFSLFIGERAERRLLRAIDARVEHDVLERFTSEHAAMESTAQEASGIAPSHVARILERLLEHADEIANANLAAWHTERAAFEARCEKQDLWLRDTSVTLASHVHRLDAASGALLKLLEEHGALNAIQAGLAENLRQIHHASQFDQAIHQLTAAVHLLTAKQRNNPLAQRPAA